jgi:cellulose synthase/poly-beta-1,6-N-acetylglucosamine synthase-like glycosyltransferase
VRARAAFRCSQAFNAKAGRLRDSPVAAATGAPPQLLSEDEISEDIELGSRIHAAGYSNVFIPENLATGEVRGETLPYAFCYTRMVSDVQRAPRVRLACWLRLAPRSSLVRFVTGTGCRFVLIDVKCCFNLWICGFVGSPRLRRRRVQVPLDARSMWRQRLRWFKGGHLFVLSKDSIFWRQQQHVTFLQKAAYCLGPAAHIVNFTAEPCAPLATQPLPACPLHQQGCI